MWCVVVFSFCFCCKIRNIVLRMGYGCQQKIKKPVSLDVEPYGPEIAYFLSEAFKLLSTNCATLLTSVTENIPLGKSYFFLINKKADL